MTAQFDTAFFERMRDYLDREADWHGMHEDNTVENLASAFEAAQNPPKPEEPTGLGAVVEDADGHTFVRTHSAADPRPWTESNGSVWYWEGIRAVRVLSSGVTA